ncbi:hypothetical protein SAMN05444920_108221 [Nonomuraea solani]|uniref:Uncharacterized protein n=1 Tax=Nonomuraea solani TaxID=1144553 RepID=A0A1H6E9H3_9ACTN|nr:hypothetical protein SAMN05444920_108221 [Nonomuraea solani]
MAGEPTAVQQAPAWANAETGFLDSGWSSDTDADEPKGRRGRRKGGRGGGGGDDDVLAAPVGGGKGRVALLSVAAVAVVLGGTVAGVKFMSSSGEAAKCQGTSCAAVQAPSSQQAPDPSEEPVEEESEAAPEEEPTEEEKTEPSVTPTPTASYSVRTPRRTTSATPTPTRTKVKASAKPTKEPTDEPLAEEEVTESPSPEASTIDDSDTGVPPTVIPDPTGTLESGPSGGSVNVQQKITQRLTTYKADLQLSNTSQQELASPTISVPVDGKVMDVDGAEWTQDGDLLILDLSESLAAGGSVDVSFTATGQGSKAQNCGLVSGECAVS